MAMIECGLCKGSGVRNVPKYGLIGTHLPPLYWEKERCHRCQGAGTLFLVPKRPDFSRAGDLVMPEWYEELTGMTAGQILLEMEKPRDEWCKEVLLLVVSIMLAESDTQVFICRREDMDVLVDENAGEGD